MITSLLHELQTKHGIRIHEGEPFKQAFYNGKLTDTEDQLKDKIELAIKHYQGADLMIGVYESDDDSPAPFSYAVVMLA